METFLSAVLGELASRSIDFLISRCSSNSKPPPLVDGLHRALLRAQVIVDETAGWRITNHAMLRQLDMLRGAMYQAYYALDSFRLEEVLERVLDRLSSMIEDADVLLLLMTSYPRRYRQPYSMHLLLDNCMFGRQTEAERVVSFLLHGHGHGAEEELEVLPIVGPDRVGKSTLVAHVCRDERVRDRFSEIVLVTAGHRGFTDDDDDELLGLAALRRRCWVEKKAKAHLDGKNGRFLAVVEVAGGDFDADGWNRMYAACKQWAPSGSKIVITGRSDKVAGAGTTAPLLLKFLPPDAYWYFFRTLAFGSTDPGAAHPRLAGVAMELARKTNGAFISGQITARVMRENLDLRFWHKVLALYENFVGRHGARFGGNPFATLNQDGPALLGRIGGASADLMVHRHYECSSSQLVELPSVTVQDVMFGGVGKAQQGEFEFVWTSPLPPYHSHVYTCEILKVKSSTGAAKRKRSMEGNSGAMAS